VDGAPLLARPHLGHAHPAGRLVVALPEPIPVELHFHATVVVGVDLFPGRADHQRGLGAFDARLVGDARRTVR